MHSRTEKERSIFILYAYTHFPSDEKQIPIFFMDRRKMILEMVQ